MAKLISHVMRWQWSEVPDPTLGRSQQSRTLCRTGTHLEWHPFSPRQAVLGSTFPSVNTLR